MTLVFSLYLVTPAPADQGYYVKLSSFEAFVPLIVSGNGAVIIGQSSGGRDLAEWSDSTGVRVLQVAPDGYDLLPKAVSSDGRYVAGVLQKYPARPETDKGTMFWWSIATGLHMLTPTEQKNDKVWQMDISDDGQEVEFFCPSQSTIPTCPGSSSVPHAWPAMAREWTQARGFEILGMDIKRRFDYIKTSGDFKSLVYGELQPSLQMQITGQTGSPVLGLQDKTGRYVLFKDIPSFSEIYGSGYSYDSLSQLRSVVTNRNVSIVALSGISSDARNNGQGTLVWNETGKEIIIKNLPDGCSSFTPSQITNSGDFFGVASCPGVESGVAFYVNKKRSLTVADWLKCHGISNDLNAYVAINSISDDGKTILGWGNLYPSVNISQSTPRETGAGTWSKQNIGDDSSRRAFLFVAHIP